MTGSDHTAASGPPPPTAMFQLLNSYRVTQCLFVAAKLGIADLLADGPKSVEELATMAGAHAEALYRTLRALASMGVFEEVAPQRFALTPLADTLRADHPESQRAPALFIGEYAYGVWAEFLSSMRTGVTTFEHVFGAPFFQYLAQHPEMSALFNQSMSANSRRTATAILSAYDFPATGVVVDAGGGQGMFLAAILRAHPALRGVLFDLPDVVASAEDVLEQAGVTDRCARVGGDFFTPPLPVGDLYTLRQIIHDWDDERSVAILRNCAQAIAPDGKVLVIEGVIPSGNTPSPVKLIDLQMLVMNGGRQRTEAEFRQIYAAAGLRLTRVIPITPDLSIVEGARAQ